MTKKILLTGFGPFAKNQENISERIALELDKLSIDEYQVQSLILPVTYFGAPKLMQETIINLNPSIVVSLGLAAERKAINPELLGINFRHSNTADNDDYIAQFETISKDSKE